jgi:hypothetical protein
MDWSFLNASVGRALIGWRNEVEEQRKAIASLKEDVARERGEMEEQQRHIGTLKEEKIRQTSEIDGLRKQFTDEQKDSTALNEALKAQVSKLQDEISRAGAQQFPPLVRSGGKFEVPDGIIAHLTRLCGGNVHDRNIVEVTSGSFERTTHGVDGAVQNIADLETCSHLWSVWRTKSEDIPHTRNTWICYDFKEKSIVPTHYAVRTYDWPVGWCHLKSWVVEISEDGKDWREVDHKEGNADLNGPSLCKTYVVGGSVCRFIRLVNIGRNHYGEDRIAIHASEIFGRLLG